MSDTHVTNLSPVDLSPEQQRIYERLIHALNNRHNRIQDKLTEALKHLKALYDVAEAAGDPIGNELESIMHSLAIVAGEGRYLQDETMQTLFSQLIRLVSAKRAYERGWQDRLRDLFGSASPEQIAILDDLLIDQNDDSEGD